MAFSPSGCKYSSNNSFVYLPVPSPIFLINSKSNAKLPFFNGNTESPSRISRFPCLLRPPLSSSIDRLNYLHRHHPHPLGCSGRIIIKLRVGGRSWGLTPMDTPPERSSFTPSPRKYVTTSDHLRHVESMATLPSGAGKIPRLNAVILGEALVSEEDDLVFPSDDFSRQALVPSLQKYLEMYIRSIEDPAGFWSDIASEFYWEEKWGKQVYSENLDIRKGSIKIEWFKGGTTNICYNCLDRHIESGNGDKIAIYWEGNEPGLDGTLTYNQLLERVCQLANYLKDVGIRKGDAAVIYLPMLMELPIAMLACARIGAVHSVVFAGFSAESLAQRIMDCKPKVVITCNAVRRGSKIINLKGIVDAALKEASQNGISVDVCLTYENESAMTKGATKWQEERDIWWQDVVPKYPTTCVVEWVDAEDPLFLLYTSGSTGKPKGVLHTTGGYMVYSATTFKYAFDYKASDIYWCTADCGWITGHSYVTYGPLLNGATVIVYEGVMNAELGDFLNHFADCIQDRKADNAHTAPNYPDPGRCWDIVDKYKVSIFYTAPTLDGEGYQEKGFLKDLKPQFLLGSKNLRSLQQVLPHTGIKQEPRRLYLEEKINSCDSIGACGIFSIEVEEEPSYIDFLLVFCKGFLISMEDFVVVGSLERYMCDFGYVTRYSRKSLRVLGSVGEPINPSAWRWFFNVVGDARCPISDTWWQTETGGFMITPLPGAWPQKPGSATFPFFGVQPVIVDEKGVEIEGECNGYLCVKNSWPGAFRTLFGDHDRYETTYFSAFPGYYFTGDGCSRDKNGYHWLTGRVDDVINVSGHRIGTAEVESALVSHPQCAEAAVVGVEHEVKGQGIYAFVTLVEGVPYSEELRKSLILAVRNQVRSDSVAKECT
ncbi:unnamed protein product [Ilex paraguariensis]|uniref:acetate--CoA ligase n=2 Tax=Magnoliopsida TaxID=3398 RepID=A0ABC8TGU1_9AQUA